jgi:integrase
MYSIIENEFVGDILSSFLKSGEATRKHHSNAPKILALLGSTQVGQLDRAALRNYVATVLSHKTSVGRNFTAATVAAHFAILRRAIRWRADELNVAAPQVPFSTRLLPKGWDVKRDRRLSPVELRMLLARAREAQVKYGIYWRMLIQLALETGARLQELVLSEWTEFDARARVWRLPAIHTKTKTARGIPLSRRAVRIMGILGSLNHARRGRVFPCFSNPDSASAGFHKLALSAGVIDFRFHDLRHEAISRMVLRKRRLHVFEIMKIVGHSDSRMLARYANLRADELVERME